MRTTIKDVAETAGVSSATVSNVINDKANVSEETRRRVQAVIQELNYRPRSSAQRRLQQSAQKSIGLVVKEIHNPYFADVIAGAQEMAGASGYDLMVASSEGDQNMESRVVESFVSKDLNGLIINPLIGPQADITHLFALKRRNIPFVMLEQVRGLQANLVDVDNTTALKKAVQYLMKQGHEHIVHFAGPDYSMHSSERAEGFRRAFFESGRAFSHDYIVPTGARLKDGYRTGRAYFRDLAPEDAPTAVVCYNDLVGIGLMRAFRELDIAVPQHVSVVGFDNIHFCEYAPVPLTSVGVPTKEMGKTAVEVLLRRIESPDREAPVVATLQAEMTIRASTEPAGEND